MLLLHFPTQPACYVGHSGRLGNGPTLEGVGNGPYWEKLGSVLTQIAKLPIDKVAQIGRKAL